MSFRAAVVFLAASRLQLQRAALFAGFLRQAVTLCMPETLQVERLASGTFRTLRPVHGRMYSFTLGDGGQLLVEERDPAQRVTLQLLDPKDDCGSWGCELPVRLRELHSHWLCR